MNHGIYPPRERSVNFVCPHPGESDLLQGIRSYVAEQCLAERLLYWTDQRLYDAIDGARGEWVVKAYAAEIIRRDAARKAVR